MDFSLVGADHAAVDVEVGTGFNSSIFDTFGHTNLTFGSHCETRSNPAFDVERPVNGEVPGRKVHIACHLILFEYADFVLLGECHHAVDIGGKCQPRRRKPTHYRWV